MMIGYKLVTCTSRGLLSFSAPAPVRYLIGVWTYPPAGCGPLAVFARQLDLFDFGRLATSVSFWECEYDLSDEVDLYAPGDDGGYALPCHLLPSGTVLASRVKLVKNVNNLFRRWQCLG